MSKRDELIKKYAAHITERFGENPDMVLLEKVTLGLGPSIYNRDSSTVSGTDEKELETVRNNFLIRKLGLEDSTALMDAINSVIVTYGVTERTKYRAVVYYMLVRHFKREAVYDRT
jgi:hypothetical protein